MGDVYGLCLFLHITHDAYHGCHAYPYLFLFLFLSTFGYLSKTGSSSPRLTPSLVSIHTTFRRKNSTHCIGRLFIQCSRYPGVYGSVFLCRGTLFTSTFTTRLIVFELAFSFYLLM